MSVQIDGTAVAAIHEGDQESVRVLTIDNLSKHNAFSGEMAQRLRDCMLAADGDPAVRCIVITGSGNDAFSSGHDLNEVMEDPETAGDPAANEAFTLPPRLGTPVIAAVNGVAYAAGFMLALNCDLRVAGRNARFCAVGSKIGLVPVGGQLSRILNILPYPVAFRMLATGLPMDADQALACNFVSQVCEPEQTLDRAVELAARIAEASPAVVRAIKTGLSTSIAHGVPAGERVEPLLAAAVRELPDGGEGAAAFLEKRPPVYSSAPSTLQERLDSVVACEVSGAAV